MIDIDKIIKSKANIYTIKGGNKAILYISVKDIVNEAIKQAVPIVLKEVSEKAEVKYEEGSKYRSGEWVVEKDSILSLEQELIQKLLKNE